MATSEEVSVGCGTKKLSYQAWWGAVLWYPLVWCW